MPTTIGPHLLGRVPSVPDPRDQQHLATVRLREMRSSLLPPNNAALIKMSIGRAYDQGYFRTLKQTEDFYRWLKARHVPPKPLPVPPVPVPPAPVPALRRRVWSLGSLLDQGDTPHCIGFGGAHFGICEPFVDRWTKANATSLYYACKQIDGEPQQENGSSVRSLAQELKTLGRIAEYVWCARVDETGTGQTQAVTDWLLHQGPVVFGTDWYDGMFTPDARGLVKITGARAGGHCFVGLGVDLDAGLVECANSWSIAWGMFGHFFIRLPDLQTLLDAQGEAMAALELPLAA